jgi:hypothetical protein
MDSQDNEFRLALLAWRRDAALAAFKGSVVHRYGPKVLMADDIMDRVVECARARKLCSLAALERETSWTYARDEKYGGAQLVALVAHYFPPLCPPEPAAHIHTPDVDMV